MQSSIDSYNTALGRFSKDQASRDEVLNYVDSADTNTKWSRQTIHSLRFSEKTSYRSSFITQALYRPFRSLFHYFDDFWNEELYQLRASFPVGVDHEKSGKNQAICLSQNAIPGRFHVLGAAYVPDFHLVGDSQTYSFYTYEKDGTNRRENITDWAVSEFRTHYADQTITKWNIFHATYAVLHHPEYRTRYAANLKRELPRIPFPPDFHAFAAAGKRLMELHIDYEQQPEYPLQQIESQDKEVEVTFRVTRMKLSKDKSELRYNDFLTLRGIPPAAFDYRLGNRSALDWVIDQYRVTTDPRSGITNDPNREDDPQYILRLIGQVITISLETNRIIASLPSLNLGE